MPHRSRSPRERTSSHTCASNPAKTVCTPDRYVGATMPRPISTRRLADR
jgi:hypothetical protein